MTAVDLPSHRGLGGRAAGEFSARRGPRRLAHIAFFYCAVVGAAALALAARHPYENANLVGLPLVLWSITGVGLAVRRASVEVGADGVRWGWRALGVRMDRGRIAQVAIYRDAVALEPRRGSTWFLSARDWDRFAALAVAMRRAGLPVVEHPRTAPWRARLQSYGRVLNGLMVAAMIGVTLTVVAAL